MQRSSRWASGSQAPEELPQYSGLLCRDEYTLELAEPPDMQTLTRQLRQPLLLITAVSVIGLLIARQIGLTGLNRRDLHQYNAFSFLYHQHEPLFFGLFIALSVIAYLLLRRVSEVSSKWLRRVRLPQNQGSVLSVALLVSVISGLGTHWVFHSYPVCVDEFMADYQAEIFASGKVHAQIDPAWQQLAIPLTPTFAIFNAERNTWISAYLPVYAAIRASFSKIGIRSLTNAVLAGLSILALAGIVRKLWPGEESFPLIASLMLATSSQFLLMSMTAFSMPAHLYLNLVWLWLYTRDGRWSWLAAPWIGVLAMGLHNPAVHGLFVLPFLIRIAVAKQLAKTVYFGSVYTLGCVLWIAWMRYVSNGVASGGGELTLSDLFVLPGLTQALIQMMNLSLMVSWQSYALVFLVLVALTTTQKWSPFERDLLWSCLITFLFYTFFRTSQSNGWGYRYAYSILGNLALLSLVGWQGLKMQVGAAKSSVLLVGSLAIALFVQLPVRSLQAERFVRPYYLSYGYIKSLPVSFVLLDANTVWSAMDFMRNDPFLQTTPKLIFSKRTTPQHIEQLKGLGSIQKVSGEALSSFGLPHVSM